MKFTHKMALVVIFGLLNASAAMASGDGFYVGGSANFSYTDFDFKVRNKVNNFTVSETTHTSDFLGNLFAGYGYTFPNCMYLGLELGSFYLPKISDSIYRTGVILTNLNIKDTFQMFNYLTVDVTPGVKFNNCLLVYGRVGSAFSQIEYSQDPTQNTPGFSSNKNVTGLRLGVGADYAISTHWSTGVDYVWTGYRKYTPDFPNNAIFSNNDPSLKTTTNYLGLHLKYNFC